MIQAEKLSEKQELDVVVNLDVPFETIIDRISVSSIIFRNVIHIIPYRVGEEKKETCMYKVMYPHHRQPIPTM